MADSLLDIDFDLDKMLGTTVNPVQGLVNDPNFQTEKNIASGLGVADALISGYGKQYAPEILLRGLINAKKGRQGVIDKQIKGYMTQQDILKKTLDAQKIRGELKRQPYQLLNEAYKADEYPSKISQSRSDAKIKGLKLNERTLRMQGIYSELKDLEKNGKTAEINYIRLNPDKYLDNIYKTDLATDYTKRPLPDEWIPRIRAIGLDPKNKANWTTTEWGYVARLIDATSVKDAADQNQANQLANYQNRQIPINEIPNINKVQKDILNEIALKKKNNVAFNTLEETNTSLKTKSYMLNDDGTANLKYYKPNIEEIQRGSIPAGVDPKFPEGVVFGSNGKNYTEEVWNNSGELFRRAWDPRLDTKNSIKEDNRVSADAKSEGKKAAYMMGEVDKSNKIIAEILSKPQFLQDLASFGGRAIVNMNLGKYGFTSNVQDIKNLFDVVRNKQFITAIGNMRNASDTGGAVGNVSNFEVEMFMNAATAMQHGGSAEFIYEQLANLYNEGKRVMAASHEVYEGYYGSKERELSGLNQYDSSNYKDIIPYKEALKQKGFEAFQDRTMTRKVNQDKEDVLKRNYQRIKESNTSKEIK